LHPCYNQPTRRRGASCVQRTSANAYTR
jgi:hypothetical protein